MPILAPQTKNVTRLNEAHGQLNLWKKQWMQ
jgi:hypothetical protein